MYRVSRHGCPHINDHPTDLLSVSKGTEYVSIMPNERMNIAITVLGVVLIFILSGYLIFASSGSYALADSLVSITILGVAKTGTDYVIPSEATVVDGSYPIQREALLYVSPEISLTTKRFLEFVISDEGQDLAIEFGFVKLSEDAMERATDIITSLTVNSRTTDVAITGSTTTLQYITACAQQYTTVATSVNGGGSGVGIADLIADRSDIAMSSRHIRMSEIDEYAASHDGENPVEIPVVVDVITIIAGGDIGVTGLNMEQIQSIFSKRYTNWSEVGGNDMEIHLVNREDGSGTRDYFVQAIMKDSDLAPSYSYNSNVGIIQYVSQTKGAIGYVGLGYALDASD